MDLVLNKAPQNARYWDRVLSVVEPVVHVARLQQEADGRRIEVDQVRLGDHRLVLFVAHALTQSNPENLSRFVQVWLKV